MSTVIDTAADSAAASAAPAAAPLPEAPRTVSIRADLLPAEIISARAADATRKRVVAGFVAVLLVLVGVYGLSWWQTNQAQDDLDNLQQQGLALQAQQQQFGPLVAAINDTSAIQAQLTKLMQGDLPWTSMLTTLRSAAPTGVTLTAVSGTITTGAAAAGTPAGTNSTPGGYSVLNRTGKQEVGTLTIQGSALTKTAIARYVDQLGTVRGLASPFVSTVTTNGASITFTVNVLLTSDALSGRFTPKIGGN